MDIELRKTLMNGFTAMRATDGDEFYNPQADVRYMLAYCMQSMEAAFQQNMWPELMEFLSQTDIASDDNLMEELRQMHLCVGRMVAWITAENPESQSTGIYEAMDEAGWKECTQRARVGYLSMLGLFHLSRVWVVGKQAHAFGRSPQTPIDIVAEATSNVMRMHDQNVHPLAESNEVLGAAVKHAYSLGTTAEQMLNRVNYVLASLDRSPDVAENAKELAKLNAMERGSVE